MEGTVPSQGGQNRSLNQIEAVPSARIFSARAVMPAPVIGASWASSAVPWRGEIGGTVWETIFGSTGVAPDQRLPSVSRYA